MIWFRSCAFCFGPYPAPPVIAGKTGRSCGSKRERVFARSPCLCYRMTTACDADPSLIRHTKVKTRDISDRHQRQSPTMVSTQTASRKRLCVEMQAQLRTLDGVPHQRPLLVRGVGAPFPVQAGSRPWVLWSVQVARHVHLVHGLGQGRALACASLVRPSHSLGVRMWNELAVFHPCTTRVVLPLSHERT